MLGRAALLILCTCTVWVGHAVTAIAAWSKPCPSSNIFRFLQAIGTWVEAVLWSIVMRELHSSISSNYY